MIYINEAHAQDVWSIGESAGSINYSHKQISDRIGYAKNFKKEFNFSFPIYCDCMNNDFETKFASWPVRYYVISNKKLVNISEPENSEIDICALFDFLDRINN